MNTLKTLRKKAMLTQVEAAKMCGVSRRTFQTYEEKGQVNNVYDELVKALEDMGINGVTPPVLSIRYIKEKTNSIFAKYESVRCAFLFGSYSRNEATPQSDVDILIVSEPMGLQFYGLASELEKELGKRVDLLSHRQLSDNEEFLARLLIEGIKIYGQKPNQTEN